MQSLPHGGKTRRSKGFLTPVMPGVVDLDPWFSCELCRTRCSSEVFRA